MDCNINLTTDYHLIRLQITMRSVVQGLNSVERSVCVLRTGTMSQRIFKQSEKMVVKSGGLFMDLHNLLANAER